MSVLLTLVQIAKPNDVVVLLVGLYDCQAIIRIEGGFLSCSSHRRRLRPLPEKELECLRRDGYVLPATCCADFGGEEGHQAIVGSKDDIDMWNTQKCHKKVVALAS